MDVPGLPPQLLNLPSNTAPLGLRAGQRLTGILTQQNNQLVFSAGRLRIPIENTANLTAGQPATVQVLSTENGLRLQLLPQSVPAPATPAGEQQQAAISATLRQVLQSLGALDRQADATALLPRALPAESQAVRELVQLLLTRGTLGRDVDALVSLAQSAARSGALPEAMAQALANIAAQMQAVEAGDWRGLLERIAKSRNPEARLAAALDGAKDLEGTLAALRGDLRQLVAQLRGNEALLVWLRGQRQLKQFEQTAQRVMERLDGSGAANLRAHEQPYIFLEIPLPPGAPIEFAQIHLLHDGAPRQKGFDKDNATIVLDLQTTQLGALWVHLGIARGHCRCTLRATSEAARTALDGAATELAEGLRGAGYENAAVQVTAWDGDRLREMAGLMRRYEGVQLKA